MNLFFWYLCCLFCFYRRDWFLLGDGFNMKIKVFFLFFVFGVYFCDVDFCWEVISLIWYDYILIGYVIKLLLICGIFVCVYKCLLLFGCIFYNYEILGL